jgi:hypothetical protein
MGFFSGARRKIKKLIPKEVRPFVPYIAAGMIGPGGLGALGQTSSRFLTAAAARGLTDDEANLKDIARAGGLAALPSALSNYGDSANVGAKYAKTAGDYIAKQGALKTGAAQGAVDMGIKAAELNEDALAKYNADLARQGINDKAGRRSAIRAIYANTGTWDMDEVDNMLDTYGYRTGGRVGYADGGSIITLMDGTKVQIPEGSYNSSGSLKDRIYSSSRGDLLREEIIRGLSFAKGGRVNYKKGGMTSEEYENFQDMLETAQGGLASLEDDEEFLPIRELRLARGGITDINMEEQIDTPSGDMMMDENVEVASNPEVMDSLNELSLMLFRRPLSDLSEDEYEELKDFAGQTSLKPGLIDEYRNYKYNAEEQGQTPMSPRDYFRMEFGAARMGVKKGGPIELNINVGGNNMEDIKGQTAGPQWYYDRIQALEFEFGDELTDEEIAEIAYDSDKFYDKMGYDPAEYKKGGRVNRAGGGMMMASADMDIPIQDLAEDFEITFGRPAESIEELKDYYRKKYEFNGDTSSSENNGIGKMANMDYREFIYDASRDNFANDMFGKDYDDLTPEEAEEIDIIIEIELGKKQVAPERMMAAEGGLMNLGGREMDLRGGGFVPMGKAERADDVPARLSKNEFVMTADAVRAAGGGSVQKGADLMYDQMKQLESQA